MNQDYNTLAMNILALLLHEPKNFKEARLSEAMFPDELLPLYKISLSLYREGAKPSPEAIAVFKHPLAGEASKLAAQILSRQPPIVGFGKLIAAATEHLCRNRMSILCRKYHELSHQTDAYFHDVLTNFQSEVISLSVSDQGGSLQAGSSFAEVENRLSWVQKNPGKLRGPSTGYIQLDKLLNGLTPRFYLFGARPSVGKTASLCDVNAALCEQHLNSVIFSLEMPADDLRERSISALSRVPISGFRDCVYTISEIRAIQTAQKKMKQWKWWINDNPNTTIGDIEAQCITMKREYGSIGMVGIDYLQLIQLPSQKDRWEMVAELSRRLKALGRVLGTAMVCLAQLRRTEGIYKKETGRTTAKRPELQDLRESGNLEQDADVVNFIHRDVRHEPEKAEFILAKQRGGPTQDEIRMEYNAPLTTFRDA
jgi:replicative DNA helicase